MRETLRQRAVPTIPAKRDRAEQHLRPSEHGVRPAVRAVRAHGPRAPRPLVDVELEVDAERELRREGQEEDICERAVRALQEPPAAVRVSEDIAAEREQAARGLRLRAAH